MRIVAGRFKGRRISAPKGMRTRPTTEKVREALFALLGPLEGLRVADLFAGSGALGLEALSRGAAHLVAVERAGGSLSALRANVEALGLGSQVRVLRRDLTRGFGFLRELGPFDLILADPPYGRDWFPALLAGLPPEALARSGRLAIETARGEGPAGPGQGAPETGPADPGQGVWRTVTQRAYGQTQITILVSERA